VIGGIPEAAIIQQVWVRPQIAGDLDGESLNGRQAVDSLRGEMDGESAPSPLRVRVLSKRRSGFCQGLQDF
jgi:hypothetical protein